MKESICFDCQNAYAHKCAWVGFGKEIDGFKCDTVKYSGTGKMIKVVRECPQFKSDRKRVNISARNKKILELAKVEGMSVRKIAVQVGCSDFTVHRVIRAYSDDARTRKCALCGSEFKIQGNARYCSRECRMRAGYTSASRKRKKREFFMGRNKDGQTSMASKRAAAK